MTPDDQAALRQAALKEAVALGGLVAALLLLQYWPQVTIRARAALAWAARAARPARPAEPTRQDWQAWRRDIARLDGETVGDPWPAA